MKFPSEAVKVEVKGLIVDPTTKSPIVILQREGQPILLPIWIGVCEANAIALALEGIKSPRPMTHDLIVDFVETLGFSVGFVYIHSIKEGTFFATIHLHDKHGVEKLIDSRPSDALAITLRAKSSIFVSDTVMAEAQMHESSQDDALKNVLERLRPEDLGDYEM